jgi:transposase
MKTMSLDLRGRIVAAYDAGKATRQRVAERFRVSLGMVKKLLWQRKRTGDLRPRHRFSGRKPMIAEAHRQRMRELWGRRPDMTLAELRSALGLNCTLPAIHYALVRLNLTYKKMHSAPANSSARR